MAKIRHANVESQIGDWTFKNGREKKEGKQKNGMKGTARFRLDCCLRGSTLTEES